MESRTRRPTVVFVMTGAWAMTGGVAAVNVQILRTLTELEKQGWIFVEVLSFTENDAARPPFLPDTISFRGFQGSKVGLALAVLNRAAKRPVFFVDYLRLAIPLLPFTISGLAQTIVFAHGREYWRKLRLSNRIILRNARLVLANSQFTLNKMRSVIPSISAEACPLGLPIQIPLRDTIPIPTNDQIELTSCDGISRTLGSRFLLLVGRMDSGEREKGHYALLNALPRLLSEFPDLQIVFAGPGDDVSNLIELAKQRGVSAAVFLPGYVSRDDLEKLYRNCYAFVMPSRQEGFGLVYLEAMNYGKPCVGCFNDGAEDVIVDGSTGMLVNDPDNLDELVPKLSKLLVNPQLALELGRNGFTRLHQHFTTAHFRARLRKHLISFLFSKSDQSANDTESMMSADQDQLNASSPGCDVP